MLVLDGANLRALDRNQKLHDRTWKRGRGRIRDLLKSTLDWAGDEGRLNPVTWIKNFMTDSEVPSILLDVDGVDILNQIPPSLCRPAPPKTRSVTASSIGIKQEDYSLSYANVVNRSRFLISSTCFNVAVWLRHLVSNFRIPTRCCTPDMILHSWPVNDGN